MKAFVIIKVEPGKVRDVYNAVRDLRNVSQAFGLTGPDDLVIMLEADDAKKVGDVILAAFTISRASRDRHPPGG